METETSGFNGDVLLEILSKLPLKSVHRFKCVSKEWNALTTTSDFLNRHRLHSRPHLLVCSNSFVANRKSARVSLLADEDEAELSSLNIPFLPKDARPNISLRIIGCSEGLVCCLTFLDDGVKDILVWNPLTQTYNHVDFPHDNNVPNSVLGFEFMRDSNVYKLVSVQGHEIDDDPDDPLKISFVAKVFTQGASSWRLVESRLDIGSCEGFRSSVFVTENGMLHWLVEHASKGFVTASFSLHDEVFGGECIPLPEEIRHSELTGLPLLISWRNSLAVVGKDQSDNFVLWVEGAADQESDWIEVMRFKWPKMREGIWLMPLTGVWKDWLVFSESKYYKKQDNLFLFDPKTKKLTKLPGETDTWFSVAVSYAESSVQP